MTDESPFLPDEDTEPEDLPTPWGFRIGLIAAGAYLLWRLVEGIIWAFDRLF